MSQNAPVETAARRDLQQKQTGLTRWEHETIVDEMKARFDYAPEMLRIRRQIVQHPFGTIKAARL
jgi:hypothetical protein